MRVGRQGRHWTGKRECHFCVSAKCVCACACLGSCCRQVFRQVRPGARGLRFVSTPPSHPTNRSSSLYRNLVNKQKDDSERLLPSPSYSGPSCSSRPSLPDESDNALHVDRRGPDMPTPDQIRTRDKNLGMDSRGDCAILIPGLGRPPPAARPPFWLGHGG